MEKEKVSYQQLISETKPELEKVVDFLKRELMKIRTERASPSLVEDIMVEYFGKKYALKKLATISIPAPRQIVIKPWDDSYIEDIVKALDRSDIGTSPIVDKDIVRINLPSLSEEFREELIHLVSEKHEQSRRTLRKWRDEIWREIQDAFQEGKMSEDDKYKGKDKLEDLINDYQEKIEEIVEKKKKEIKK